MNYTIEEYAEQLSKEIDFKFNFNIYNRRMPKFGNRDSEFNFRYTLLLVFLINDSMSASNFPTQIKNDISNLLFNIKLQAFESIVPENIFHSAKNIIDKYFSPNFDSEDLLANVIDELLSNFTSDVKNPEFDWFRYDIKNFCDGIYCFNNHTFYKTDKDNNVTLCDNRELKSENMRLTNELSRKLVKDKFIYANLRNLQSKNCLIATAIGLVVSYLVYLIWGNPFSVMLFVLVLLCSFFYFAYPDALEDRYTIIIFAIVAIFLPLYSMELYNILPHWVLPGIISLYLIDAFLKYSAD